MILRGRLRAVKPRLLLWEQVGDSFRMKCSQIGVSNDYVISFTINEVEAGLVGEVK